jgi:hypothetical protein
MRARALCGVCLLAIAAAALGGCGSSTPAAAPSATSAGDATAATTGPQGNVLRTSPAPLPAGTPPAPPGLARTGGYGTYELCRADCEGAVPASMRRALHLPARRRAACPASSASAGAVSAGGGSAETAERFVGSRWRAARVTWRAAPGYRGPILIRGRRLDAGRTGGAAVGLGEGHRPYDELQLMSSGRGAPASAAGGGRAWLTLTRVRTPGCYAYQVDGTSFSNVIVFRVRA